MNFWQQYHTGAGIVAGVIVGLFMLRQCLIILAAEQGRKHDLVKKLYKNTQEFQLSVLIPFLNPHHHAALLSLLQAIADQDYPASKVTVHLVTTEESARDLIPQSLRPNVRLWQYPQGNPRYEHAITWLIDRCLAAGGNGLFVFLKPTDIIKPDFFRNVVVRGMDSFAIQGYVALKNMPETPLAKVYALSTRLFNRIGNAGRYHLGLSCRLLDSGWAIKQEVLEMIPYRRGMDLDNLEYSLRLNLENFRINWAPNVVVYSEADVHFLDHLTLSLGALFNRLNLLLRYGPRLLSKLVLRFDLNYLEQLLAIVKPPLLTAFFAFVALGLLDQQTAIPIPGEPIFWGIAAAGMLVLDMLGLVVAKCRTADFATLLFYTPLVYLFGVVVSPLALFSYIQQRFGRRTAKGSTYRRMAKTRFNEELEAPPSLFDDEETGRNVRRFLQNNAPASGDFDFEALGSRKSRKRAPVSEPASPEAPVYHEESLVTSRMKLPRETVKAVPLSNGQKQVSCRLKTLTTFNEAGEESFRLTLEYKSMSFSTNAYRILDQAFYELQAKLMSRGLTVMTCGSCGNFYNPTADVPGALRNAGVCLFGKTGKEVNLNTDAVTVISQACSYHCPLNQRENIVRQWKESLALSRSAR